MSHEDVIAMMEEIGLEFAYSHFAEGEAPDPPFICFLYPNSENFGADDSVYFPMTALDIELYTDLKDPALETAVEAVLGNHDIFWEKTEVWIESEKLYEVCYSVTV